MLPPGPGIFRGYTFVTGMNVCSGENTVKSGAVGTQAACERVVRNAVKKENWGWITEEFL